MRTPSREMLYNRPALFDWMVFILSFSLGFIYPRIGDFVISKEFSWWMFGCFVLYVLGSWLKHIPLSHRIQVTGKKREISYVIFLLAGHWCIMLVVMIFSEAAFLKLLGLKSYINKKEISGWEIFFDMFFSAFVTWLVYRSKKLPRNYKPVPERRLWMRELVADTCLVLSVSVLTFVIWEKGIIALLSNKAVGSFSEVWFLFVMLSITYLLLYLPLRYLYLVEDMSSRQTWRRMLLIFAFLLLRSFFEIMRG
jgi:hypothetical protein